MKKYFSFRGRIRRTHFALRYLLNFSIGFLVGLVSGAFPPFLILGVPVLIAATWFGLATCAQRCHDMDKSGWYSFIPFYGAIIMFFVEGTQGSNKYGEDPKLATSQNISGNLVQQTQPQKVMDTANTNYSRNTYIDVENDPNQGAASYSASNSQHNQSKPGTHPQAPPPSKSGGYKKGSLYD